MPNFIDDDTALPATKVERRAVPPGESATKFIQASDVNAVFQALEDTRDAVQAIQAAPVAVDGTTITGAGTVADPLVAVGGGGGGGSGTVGPGTTSTIAMFTGPTTVDDSPVTYNSAGNYLNMAGIVRFLQLQCSTYIQPVLASGTTENWNPTGLETAGVINAQANTAGSAIGGITAPTTANTKDGRLVLLLNHGDGSGSRGTSPLIIKHRSSGSSAVNRIVCPDLTDIELPYTGGALLKYEGDGSASGSWFVIAMSNGGRYLRQVVGDLWFKGNYPSALATGNNNDWEPTNWADHTLHEVLVNSGAIITGLKNYFNNVSPDPYQNTIYLSGVVRVIVNRSTTAAIKVLHDSSLSSSVNRIYSPVGDFEIPPNGTSVFIYDYSSARWRAITGAFGSFSNLFVTGQALVTLASGNNNDWTPTDFSTTGAYGIQVGSGSVITGMLAQNQGAIRTLVAFGTFTIKHADANSANANQFYLPFAYQAAGLQLNLGDTVTVRYHGSGTNKWMVIGIGQ